MYVFGRDVADLISLNMSEKCTGKVIKGDFSLGMRSLNFLGNGLRCTQIAMTVL